MEIICYQIRVRWTDPSSSYVPKYVNRIRYTTNFSCKKHMAHNNEKHLWSRVIQQVKSIIGKNIEYRKLRMNILLTMTYDNCKAKLGKGAFK